MSESRSRLDKALHAAINHLGAQSASIEYEQGLGHFFPLDDPDVPLDSPIRRTITGVSITIDDSREWYADVDQAVARLEQIASCTAHQWIHKGRIVEGKSKTAIQLYDSFRCAVCTLRRRVAIELPGLNDMPIIDPDGVALVPRMP